MNVTWEEIKILADKESFFFLLCLKGVYKNLKRHLIKNKRSAKNLRNAKLQTKDG